MASDLLTAEPAVADYAAVPKVANVVFAERTGPPAVLAFQLVHDGEVVAEAPLVVHDIDRAIRVAEQCIAGDPMYRGQAADILALLLAFKGGQAEKYTGTYLAYRPESGASGG